MPEYRPYITDDGSIGLFSGDYDDIFHSRYGALTEAYEKFINPIDLKSNLSKESLSILDICYGIGYNTKAFLNNFQKEIIEEFVISNRDMPIIKSRKNLDSYTESTVADKINTLEELAIDVKDEIQVSLDTKKRIIAESSLYANFLQSKKSTKKKDCLKNFFQNYCNDLVSTKEKSEKDLNDLISKVPTVSIDALEFEKEFVDISPFIKSVCNNKDYLLSENVNIFILNSLIKQYGKNYITRLAKYEVINKNAKFFDIPGVRNSINSFKSRCGYMPKASLTTLLHNIYYRHISKRLYNISEVSPYLIYQNLSKRDSGAVMKNFGVNNSEYPSDILSNFVTLNFYTDDARVSIKNLDKEYDFIFLDAFTPTKLPTLWTVEFFSELYKRLKPDGILLTYSNSARIRAAMLEAGFKIGNIKSDKNHFIGTMAAKFENKIKYPLSELELGLIKTKAGIPYRDATLSATPGEIIKTLDNELEISDRISSSQYLKGGKNEV